VKTATKLSIFRSQVRSVIKERIGACQAHIEPSKTEPACWFLLEMNYKMM
jgi:hypothetical protein